MKHYITSLFCIVCVTLISCSKSPTQEAVVVKEGFPLIAANTNLSSAIDRLSEELADRDKVTPEFKELKAFVDRHQLGSCWLYIYPSEEHVLLPVLVMDISIDTLLATAKEKGLEDYFTQQPDGSFVVKDLSSINEHIPEEEYIVKRHGTQMVLAPKSMFQKWDAGLAFPTELPLSQSLLSIEDPDNLFSLAVGFPEMMADSIDNEINKLMKGEKGMATFISRGISAFFTELVKPFEQIDSLAIAMRAPKNEVRSLVYTQNFRKAENASLYEGMLNQGDWETADIDDFVWSLLNFTNQDFVKSNASSQQNKLMLRMEWAKADDDAFAEGLGKATIGYMFSRAMGGGSKPTEGPIEPDYIDEPVITEQIDVNTLEQSLNNKIKESLFPANYWDSGSEPYMLIECDRVDIANAFLSEIKYEVTAVNSKDGNDLLRVTENKFSNNLPLDSDFTHIRIPVLEGTEAKQLGYATLRFDAKIATGVKTLEFTSKDAANTSKMSGSLKATLQKMDRDVVSVVVRGEENIKLIAYDSEGRALDSKSSSWGHGRFSGRYEGVIDRVKVLVVSDYWENNFSIDVDLNNGDRIEGAREALDDVRTRYDYSSVDEYRNFDESILEEVSVSWIDPEKVYGQEGLRLNLPKNIQARAQWSTNYFQKGKPAYIQSSDYRSGGIFVNTLGKGTVDSLDAVFGKVKIVAKNQFERLQFQKLENTKEMEQSLSNGKKIKLIIDRNEIRYNFDGMNSIQLIAYASNGKRLKKVNYSRSKDGWQNAYFWGMVDSVAVDFSLKEVERIIPFELKRAISDESAYERYKSQVAVEEKVGSELKKLVRQIDNKWHRLRYGQSIAGFYYLHYKNKPTEFISQEIAHADPTGSTVFGYETKLFNGYHFRFLKGTTKNGKSVDYPLSSKEREWQYGTNVLKGFSYDSKPMIVAEPVDRNYPFMLVRWGNFYKKVVQEGQSVDFEPEDFDEEGWVEFRIIE